MLPRRITPARAVIAAYSKMTPPILLKKIPSWIRDAYFPIPPCILFFTTHQPSRVRVRAEKILTGWRKLTSQARRRCASQKKVPEILKVEHGSYMPTVCESQVCAAKFRFSEAVLRRDSRGCCCWHTTICNPTRSYWTRIETSGERSRDAQTVDKWTAHFLG
jgi:hypothetical protein